MKKILFLTFLIGSLFSEKLYFLSTQLVPVEEAEWFRRNVLSEFKKKNNIEVIFLGAGYGEFQDRISSEYKAGKGKIDVTAGLSSDYESISDAFVSLENYLNKLKNKGTEFISSLIKYIKIKNKIIYIPWLQSTYIFVCNKKALKYLPEGAKLDSLTYDELLLWVKNIYENEKLRKFGLPGGPRGLIHRFIHGYLYPSFTGTQILNFDSKEAIKMWKFFKELWKYANPASSIWEKMDTPLLQEEVWIAWDHVSRIKRAIIERPDDFIIFPAPRGIKGRGVMEVIVGLAIPSYSDKKDKSFRLIEFLLKPYIQKKMIKGTGFFPVIKNVNFGDVKGGIKKIAEGVQKQNSMKDIIASFIPGGLGKRQGEFTKILRDVFREIIIKNKKPEKLLPSYKNKIMNLFKETKAPLPVPDKEVK